MACFHSYLNELPFELRGLCFQEHRFNLYSLSFQGEFCRYSEGFYLCFVGLSRSTYKLCGKHMRTKKICHPCSCCKFAADELFAGVRSPELIRISSSCDITASSQDSATVSGLLTEKSDLRSCFCVLTMRYRGGVRFVLKQKAYFKSARRHPKIMVNS